MYFVKAFLPERSKGSVLSSDIFVCVGSNPTECTFKETNSNYSPLYIGRDMGSIPIEGKSFVA